MTLFSRKELYEKRWKYFSSIGDARSNESSLGVLFTCSTCDMPGGGIKGMVFDRTATGLLRKLSDFYKDEIVIPAMKPAGAGNLFLRSGCGDEKSREALRFVFREAACQAEAKGYFEVPVTAKRKRKKKTVLDRCASLDEFLGDRCIGADAKCPPLS